MAYGGYVDPLAHANVTPERIDMGVDYAGTGTYTALGPGIVTQINPGGWGGYGNFIEYVLTGGPLRGRTVYYAEGVNPVPGLRVGESLTAGQPVVNLIPGWHSGTEIGFGGAPSSQDSTYATAYGGGYTEGARTAAGNAFSNLVADLGGPPGLPEGRPVSGTFSGNVPAAQLGAIAGLQSTASTQGGIIPGSSWISGVASFLTNPMHALVTIALVIGGAFMLYKGATSALGSDQKRRAA